MIQYLSQYSSIISVLRQNRDMLVFYCWLAVSLVTFHMIEPAGRLVGVLRNMCMELEGRDMRKIELRHICGKNK